MSFHLLLRLLVPAALILAGSVSASELIAWSEPVTVAQGKAVRGSWQQNDSRYDFVDDGTVALDPQGNAAVAWVDQARKQVLFQRYAPDGGKRFPQAVPVSRSPKHFSWLPRIALLPGAPQRVYLIWQDIIFSGGSHGGDIMFARSGDGGATFSEPINLSHSVEGAGKGRITRRHWHNGSYDLAIAPDGTIHVAWTEFEGRLLTARSSDGGVRFSQPQHVAGNDAQPARGPTLAASMDGHVYLGWTSGENAAADIRVAQSNDAGATFEAARVAARTGTYSDAPKLALDADGRLHLAYAESLAGPFDRFRIHYTYSDDSAASFQAPREISSPAPGNAASAHFPHLALDGAGNPVVTWELYPEQGSAPRGLGIAVSRDRGRSFSTPAEVPGSRDPAGGRNGSTQGLLMSKLAVNDSGALAIVNSSFLENEGSRVWLLRGRLR